ncbi:hypothetical protein KVR01_010980 [Diaporthe batatas]|uniref:uncharacterized protein n=1 Tax=Diaporthe batatas TaxID=748121 RepID=UPI001D04C92D|nr:uncharacterized protein KVR01_010980 [Diaporthe batatas]KAG8159319.1 hypothetical protein KVR01_010980 [Diaporthe batatas]
MERPGQDEFRSYKTNKMIPLYRHEAFASVGTSNPTSTRGRKRDRFSPENANVPAAKPVAKKARTLAHRYPGVHVEVWHQSELSVQTKTTAEYELGQQLPVPALTPSSGLSSTLGTSRSSFIPICNGWPSYQVTCFEPGTQGAQESVCLQSFPPVLAALSFPTYSRFGQSSSDTSSLSTVSINSSPQAGLFESQVFFAPKQTEGFDLHTEACNDFLPTCQDTTSDLAEYPHSGLPCFPEPVPHDVVMGGGERFPISQHDVASNPALVSKPEQQQHTLYHDPWQTQELGVTPMPNLLAWTDTEIPAQHPFSQRASHVDTPPSQPLLSREEDRFNDTAHEDQMSHNDGLPLRLSRFQDSGVEDAGVGEKILAVCENSQGTSECACAGHSPNSPCSSCASPQSWVMVTYELVKPSKDDKPKKLPKPRKRLDHNARAQTSQTREVGACVRCKIQRVRCVPNGDDPCGPCEACSRVALNHSRKVLHHIGCHRYILRELVLFRSSGSRVTDRWHSAQVRNVMTEGKTFTVKIEQDFVGRSFECQVRKVSNNPNSTHKDRTTRDWYNGTTVKREAVLEYALVDVNETMIRYKDYIRDNVLGHNYPPAIAKVVEGYRKPEQGVDTTIVAEVYEKAWAYFCSLPSEEKTWDFYQPWPRGNKNDSEKLVSEKGFLLGLFELQFALRHSTGWSWLGEGVNIPNARPCQDFPPLKGRIMTPRMVVGQLDCIRISCVLKPLTRAILRVMMSWVGDRQYNRWMSIFFATFVLLSELSKITEDAYLHGWYDKDIKGDGPKHAHIIRDVHESANILLAHWHYYSCSTDPFGPFDKKYPRSKTPLRELTPDQLVMVQNLWSGLRQWKERPCDDELYKNTKNEKWWQKWCHSLYFVDQMIDTSWKPRQVFA